ncbi:hypothetical protein CspeluHIS016_0803000 [Cutaneotrichosporon spelunceum]|uniref:Cation efflux protein transmembrane domain-containing protein n=1 Tax=Cutaneotrichosporon spelunceum TaxID=1672016 RepID=A0AAD3YF41_9TREE|nr:hypothetical protein CspeluHIS016_0803000 [Cutaneotrichosporon spelunceum]
MSSPNTVKGGGFYSHPYPTTLGYTNPRAQRVATLPPTPGVDEHPAPHNEPHTLIRHRPRRGMSVERMQSVISSKERSVTDFVSVPISPEEIKQQPKKLRPYYKNLEKIHDGYNEVDGLLSGELPSIIANSFLTEPLLGESGPRRSNSTASLGGAESRATSPHPYWNLRSLRHWGPIDEGMMRANGDEEAATERTPLVLGAREAERERLVSFAINVNTVVNFILVGAKIVAVLYSSSISLIASLVDSALDLLSSLIIVATNWAIGVPTDLHLYPAGKRRFEPLGVLIFSVVMIVSFVQVFIESAQRLNRAIRGDESPVDLSPVGIGTMLATIVVKAVLWMWCSNIPSSSVQALAQDAENDVWLNTISLSFPYIGHKLGSNLLDPIGGLCLSAYIIIEWIKTLLQNFANLSGKRASADQYTRVLYMVSRFNPVLEISEVEVYHIGDDLVVEVDVILPRKTSLRFAHDIGETIQCMLENLDGVLRAYVHTDYSSSNPSQHTSRRKDGTHPVPLRAPSPDDDSPSISGSATPRASAGPFHQRGREVFRK